MKIISAAGGTRAWFRSHARQVLVHGCILGGFAVYAFFLAGPLFERFEAMPGEARLVQLQLPGETNNIAGDLERMVASESALEIHGWAFIEGRDNENSSTFIVLKSSKRTYVFDTVPAFTPYVTEWYPEWSLNLDWSGFMASIPTRKIERGDYAVGLYIAKDGTQALQYTSRTVVKSRAAKKPVLLASHGPRLPPHALGW